MPELTPAQDAIQQADSYLSNAVLPTYTELLQALRAVTAASASRELQKTVGNLKQLVSAHELADRLLSRHDRTQAGDFRG